MFVHIDFLNQPNTTVVPRCVPSAETI